MINRRNLLAGILAAGVSPWIVKAGVLMPMKTIIVPSNIWSGNPRIAIMKAEILKHAKPICLLSGGIDDVRPPDEFGKYGFIKYNRDASLYTVRRFHSTLID